MLKICSFSDLCSSLGSVQVICIFLAWNRRSPTLISVKTLIRRLPDLPNLLCHPCYVHVYSCISTVPIIMCLVTQWQQIVPAFICLSNLFHCFSNTLLFTCSTASSGRHTLVYPFTIELTMYKRMHEFILDGEVAYDN